MWVFLLTVSQRRCFQRHAEVKILYGKFWLHYSMEMRKLDFVQQNSGLNERKSKLKINGMHMRNLLWSLCETEISSSRRRSREKKNKKTTWRHFGFENYDLSVNCILWGEKKPLVNTFFLSCSIDRKKSNGETLRRAFRHFRLNE